MTLYYLPIQPLEERYTEQWYRWFPQAFDRRDIEWKMVDGEALIEDEIKTGTFLDINSSAHWMATQNAAVAKLFCQGAVKNGDIFFVADVEHFGIENIRYLATLNDIDIRIVGFVHAGSYTKGDFFEKCSPFAFQYENGWSRVFDILCVGSEYHRHAYCHSRGGDWQKVRVTGNPYYLSELPEGREWDTRNFHVVHTNRPDPEKNPNEALDALALLKQRNPDWNMAVTTGRREWGSGALRQRALRMERTGVFTIYEGITKDNYLRLLGDSKVMTGNSPEENFGYCILEAMGMGAQPVIPKHCSHPELLCGTASLLFTPGDMEDQVKKIEKAVEQPLDVQKFALRYESSMDKIIDLCMQ